MPEPLDESVRKRFRGQKTRDTAPELAVRKLLHEMGFRYRLNLRAEPEVSSKADVLFERARVAVYVDGCFWHGCPDHFIPPKNNGAWWVEKIEGNRARDCSARRQLSDLGWMVLSFWEHESPSEVAVVVGSVVTERLAAHKS